MQIILKTIAYRPFKRRGVFDVAKDKDHPFTIAAKQLLIEVIGTSFNVNATIPDSTTVVVYSGMVKITDKQTNDTFLIHKNESITVYLAQGISAKKTVTASTNTISWKTNIYEFEKKKLKDVFPILEKGYNTAFTVQNPEILEYELSAVFDNQDIEVVLEILKQTFNIEYAMHNGVYVFEMKNQ
ncbi:MAG: DUF4974 domain-containing protein [Bacteroidales bacterium]|nr:DUF4974 domain-containing protein [Bacteroidales bacterium]